MRYIHSLLLSAVVVVVATSADSKSQPGAITRSRKLPGGYIVELGPKSTPSKRAVHEEFLEALDKRVAGKFVTRKKYESDLFNGIAVQLKTPEDFVHFQDLPNVVSVKPITIHPMPQTFNQMVVASPHDAPIYDGQSTHKMTGVDKAHAAGFTGKGIKIAIIDSGVDYTHPNLGGKFGAGNKVIGGHDFVGDDYTGDNTPAPDDDPMDCVGHGTHVAGILGANAGNKFNVSGVAYDASILAYRVFGCRGGAGDDVLIDSFIRAEKEGADIITMSLGLADGWADSSIALVASRIAGRGKVVTVAAGNDGDAGVMFTSTPGTGQNVIATASVENTEIPLPYITTTSSDKKLPYKPANFLIPLGQALPLDQTTYPVNTAYADPNSTDQACEALPQDVDLTGVAVLVRANFSDVDSDTGCRSWMQIFNLQDRGASLFLFYDVNDPYLLPIFAMPIYDT